MTPTRTGRLMVRCPFCGEEKDSGILADEKLTKAFGHALCHNGHNFEWSLGETYVGMVESETT
jgi:hypothetical protein